MKETTHGHLILKACLWDHEANGVSQSYLLLLFLIRKKKQKKGRTSSWRTMSKVMMTMTRMIMVLGLGASRSKLAFKSSVPWPQATFSDQFVAKRFSSQFGIANPLLLVGTTLMDTHKSYFTRNDINVFTGILCRTCLSWNNNNKASKRFWSLHVLQRDKTMPSAMSCFVACVRLC